MKIVHLDPRTWMRGEHNSMLRTNEGRQCCMGFYARACGLSEDQITGVFTLSGLGDMAPEGFREESDSEDSETTLVTDVLGEVYYLNDVVGLDDAERVHRLNVCVFTHGIEFVLDEGTDVVG